MLNGSYNQQSIWDFDQMLHDLTAHTIVHGNRHYFMCRIEILTSTPYNTIIKRSVEIKTKKPITMRISLLTAHCSHVTPHMLPLPAHCSPCVKDVLRNIKITGSYSHL